MFYEEVRTKQDLSYISICSLSILYNSKCGNVVGNKSCRYNEESLYYLQIEDKDEGKDGDVYLSIHVPEKWLSLFVYTRRLPIVNMSFKCSRRECVCIPF